VETALIYFFRLYYTPVDAPQAVKGTVIPKNYDEHLDIDNANLSFFLNQLPGNTMRQKKDQGMAIQQSKLKIIQKQVVLFF